MGQKSRNKKSGKNTKSNQSVQNTGSTVVRSTADRPSFVSASLGYQPKSATIIQSPASLGVNSGDVRRVIILLSLTVVLFIALAIVNSKSSLLSNAGTKLVHTLNF
jgi:hypothetical protein